MIRSFLELYALHLLIAVIANYAIFPLLPESLTKPYLKTASALRKRISLTIESFYDKKNVELYLTSRVLGPFLVFISLNSLIIDYLLSIDGYVGTKTLGWILYISLIINSVPAIDEWDFITQGDAFPWALVWVKIALLIDFVASPKNNLIPPEFAFIAIFLPFSAIIPIDFEFP